MLYWGPNVNHMYHLHFCFKVLEPPHDYNFQSAPHLRLVWISFLTFSHTRESVFESLSNLLQLSYFNFNYKPKAKVTTLEIDIHYFFFIF
jgi:hypothetical protein